MHFELKCEIFLIKYFIYILFIYNKLFFDFYDMINIKDISSSLRTQIASEVSNLKENNVTPRVDVVLVGTDESSKIYAQTKKRVAEELWITLNIHDFPENSTQTEINNFVEKLSLDRKINGILIESPLPEWLSYNEAIGKILSSKDIDWLHIENQWKLLSWELDSAIIPATPLACLEIIKNLVEDISWKNILIIWRWKTVWKPLANLLIWEWATVTVANSKTKNLKELALRSDIIVTATGKIWILTADMVTSESIIVDAWISVDENWKIYWDVDYENVSKLAKYVTPVPGWVWLITTSMIFKNLLKAIELQHFQDDLDLSVNQFIKLSSWPNMPWGGGVASIVWALWASMSSMVASLTKDDDLDITVKQKLIEYVNSLKNFYEADISAFNWYLEAARLPKETEEQKKFRQEKIQESLTNSSNIPFEFIKAILDWIPLIKKCVENWNQNVVSDAFVSIHLLKAAWLSSLEWVKSNINFIKDEKIKKDICEKYVQFSQSISWINI